MAFTSTQVDTFKLETWQGGHDFDNDALKIALYDSNATLDKSTTVYSVTDEISGAGYSAGGIALTTETGYPKVENNLVLMDFLDPAWASSTLSDVAGALIYNTSNSNKAVAVRRRRLRAVRTQRSCDRRSEQGRPRRLQRRCLFRSGV